MSCDLSPGMRVLCVHGYESERLNGYGDENLPVTGRVYTIRDVSRDSMDDTPIVLLNEVVNRKRRYILADGRSVVVEPWFVASRFRPLDERRIDVFRAILKKAPVSERVPA